MENDVDERKENREIMGMLMNVDALKENAAIEKGGGSNIVADNSNDLWYPFRNWTGESRG